MMTIILAFTAASFVASALVVSACAMSSRISQREGVGECFEKCEETVRNAATTVAPFSAN